MENLNQNSGPVVSSTMAAQIMSQNRQLAQKYYGPLFGKQIFTIVAVNPDPKWKENTMNGINDFRFEIKGYIIKAIDVMSVCIVPKDLDQRPKIGINVGIEGVEPMMFEIAEPDFSKATREAVTEAIERLGKPGSKPMFFSAEDLPNLDKLVEVANNGSIAAYEDMARKCMNLSKTVRGYSENNRRIYTNYMRECGVNSSEIEVNVHIEKLSNRYERKIITFSG